MERLDGTPFGPYELGVRDNGVAVTNAPDFALLSIETLTHLDRGVKLHANMVTLGGGMVEGTFTQPISYEIIGLALENRALVLRREDVNGSPPQDLF